MSKERQIRAYKVLFDTLLSDIDRYEPLLLDIVEQAEELEADDFFGTEGLNV